MLVCADYHMQIYSKEEDIVGNLTSPVAYIVGEKCLKFNWKTMMAYGDSGAINVYIRKEIDFSREWIRQIPSDLPEEWIQAYVTLNPGTYRIQFQNHPMVTLMGIDAIEILDGECVTESRCLT